MPFIPFEAIDANGKVVRGTLQAESVQQLELILLQKGLKLVSQGGHAQPNHPLQPVQKPQQPARPMQSARPVQAQTPKPQPAPAKKPAPVRPAQIINSPQPKPTASDFVYTKPAHDKHRFLLFTQLAALFRTGHSANTAFDHVAGQSLERFRPSYAWIISQTSQGIPMSEAMAKYPDLYPRAVTQTVKVGELSGNLPEALDIVSTQAEQAHRYKKWHWWLWAVVINALLSIPGMMLATRGMLHTWDRIDSSGGSSADGKLMGMGEATHNSFAGLGDALKGPYGLLTVLLFVVVVALYYYYKSRKAQAFRHRMGAQFPFISSRAKQENIERFSWSLGKLMQAGQTPANSWEMASRSVPNDHYFNILSEGNIMIKENVRLSQILGKSKVFSDEMSALVSVAETTGDFAGALEQSRKFAEGEKKSAENYAKLRIGGFGCLGCFLTSAIMLGILMWAWYHELPAKVLSGMDP